MSKTLNQYTIVGALNGASDFLNVKPVWTATNAFHQALLEGHFDGPLADLPELEKLDLMETKADKSEIPLNALLKKRGFSIELDPFAPGQFGVVSILEMLVGWLVKGERIKLDCTDGVKHDAVHLKDRARVEFRRGTLGGVELDIAAVPAVFGLDHHDADSNDEDENAPLPDPDVKVYMTRLDDVPAGFGLIDAACELSGNMQPTGGYEGLMFPMVSLDDKPAEISELCGIRTTDADGRGWEVGQALQQNILKMNEKGALAKSATAIMTRCTSVGRYIPPMVIDGPFLCWFEIDGMAEPLFVAHCTEDCFEDPGDLE